MSPDDLREIALRVVDAYEWGVADGWVGLSVAIVVGLGAALLVQWSAVRRWLRVSSAPASRWAGATQLAIAAVATGVGLVLAWSMASLVDDAFISFRYVNRLLDGDGLVFNRGDRVEGYTNFLWVMLLAALRVLTGQSAPLVGLAACLACYVAHLAVVLGIGRRLGRETGYHPVVPIAVLLLAMHSTFTEFATTGLETMASSLLVSVGAWAMLDADRPRRAFGAGAALILATLTRPDHGLFFVVGFAALFSTALPALLSAPLRGRHALLVELRPLLAYSAPFVGYLAYLGWKLVYYGDILPNTYYAKSASQTNWPQGLAYVGLFAIGAHVTLTWPVLWRWSRRSLRSPALVRFRAFCLGAMLVYVVYVARVGGDFMYGRFLVSLLPLAALGLEHELAAWVADERTDWTARGRLNLAAAFVFVAVAAVGVSMNPRGEMMAGIAQERRYYPVEELEPLRILHRNDEAGRILERLAATGHRPLVATTGIGLVGYYSGLPILDLLGLTDSYVANQELVVRRRPGHEKLADDAYVRRRRPVILRTWWPRDPDYSVLTQIDVGNRTGRWSLGYYDRELMDAVATTVPEIKFTRFPEWFDAWARERQKAGLPPEKRRRLQADIAFFRRFYFDWNEDPDRLAALRRVMDVHVPPLSPAFTQDP